MYLFFSVVPHQDATFLFTEPMTVVGFWIALEDATVENGCLHFARGSHNSGVHRRFIRNPEKDSDNLLMYDSPPANYPASNFHPVPVKKGTSFNITVYIFIMSFIILYHYLP